ncbi:gp58-like family protein [Lactobacillus johnsonii]|uniref:gp58-like family protein n=1 Tax=Lactobacillus johnsonii TaxID=33959 RepID=UPI00309F3D44
MLKQIKEVQDAWRATQRTLDIKVVVNDKTYRATDINSLKYDSGAYTGDTFSIGSTYSNNVQIEFSHLVEGLKLGMEVHPSIGIKTSKGYIYEPLGIFIISSEIKMDRNNNLTSISASDRFCGLEGTYKSKLVYPAKVLDIVAEICAQSGVKANADDLARLPHQADIPIPISGQSYRKALGWIAQLYAGYATFDRQGLFTIRTIAEPNYELDPSQYEQAGLTKNEAPYKIGGIQCQTVITTKTRDGENTEETKTYQVGDTSGSQIKLENNIMTPDRLNNIWEQIKDISFYPFNLNWFGNPAIEAGDWIRLEDKQGNKFIVPNNSYTLDFNGGLSATSKADQTSSTDSAISWRGTYAQIIEELKARKAPDGTVIFPPSVVEPPKNAKPNDVWFKQNGNSTELWVFTEQEDGTGKWIRRDLTPDEIKKQVQEVQSGLSDAKKQIADNLDKADGDIAELNVSIREQKGTIDGLSATVNTIAIPKITDVTNKVSDALTKINDQKNIVSGLQNQATQQGKDISKITTDIHGVTVDLANLNGDVNQTKATVQGLQSTLGNAQGDIAQIKVDAKKLETSLSGKVDNSTYATFVNQTNQALNAKLVASDLNGYAKTTDVQATANGLQLNINSVTDKLNNLRIGGRNLVGGTDKEYVMGLGIPNTVWKDNFAYTSLPLISGDGGEILPQGAGFWHVLSPGEEYTQTIWIETDATIKSLNGTFLTWLTMDDGHDVQKAYIQRIGNNSYKIVGSYTWPQNKKGNRVRLFDIFNLPNSIDLKSGTYLKFGKLKLEVGNASTDWTPAVEDTEQDLESLSARITINSQQFGSYYTKGESDNRTNTAKNEVINSIKNDSNWHGLTNILTNSGFIQTADGFIQKVQQTMQPIINENNSGGVNLLTNTYTLRNFNNAGNAGETTGFGIDSGDSHKNELNAGEISTNVFHVYAKDLNHAPVYFGQNFTLPKGTWTLSFLVRHNGSSEQKIRLSFYTEDCANRGWIPLGTSDEIDNIWKRHQITFTTTQEIFEQNPRVHMPTDDIVPGGSLYFANFKLESGSIATTWCPSPEDLAKQVEVTELNQTIKGLQSTVSSNYGNLQSQISQTAGTIRNEITDRTNNLQSQITQNANNISIKVNAVGDLSNICLNPTFIDGSTEGWENVFSSSGDPGSPTKFYGGVNTRNAFYGNMFAVVAGDKYFFSVFAWQNQSTHPLNIGFTYLQKDGTWNWQSAINFAPNEGTRTKSGSITIPKEAVKARIWVEIDSYSDFGNWWFTNLIVRKNDTISQINMSAGTTLIQNDKIYMDASSTVFSGKAFIPDAAITTISADKINTGTLDAGRINVINLNANNITTGIINGANLKINLNSGEILFQKGRIASTNGYLNIDIDSGKMSVTNSTNSGVFFENGELYLSDNWAYGTNSQPKYGVIRRSIHSFTLGECGAEIASPSGISLQTMNYDGAFGAAGFLDQTKNGASVAIDRNGQALINAKQVGLTGGTFFSDNKFIPSKRRPRIVVGTDADASGLNLWGWGDPLNHVASRIVIDASYVHFPNSYNTTTGSAPNLYIASDGAIVRSTSASKYKTDIKRSYSTEYGEKLLNLPTAIWTDKGQKERYEAGKRHIKPEKYFGMIAEDLADAGLDLLVSRNPLTHEIEGIQYERIAPALLPVIKKLKDKVDKLEEKINE